MARIVNVHHVDKGAFIKGNVKVDVEEVVMVFERSPTLLMPRLWKDARKN